MGGSECVCGKMEMERKSLTGGTDPLILPPGFLPVTITQEEEGQSHRMKKRKARIELHNKREAGRWISDSLPP